MRTLNLWAASLALCIAYGCTYMLDEPTETETAQAVAEDLQDAITTAQAKEGH
jgi:hypothetical protein